jgi:anti-sigma regulatory factor (Ser/Thr protein kinase)
MGSVRARAETTLVHDASAPITARRALEQLAHDLSEDQLRDARIVVTELVSNSVRHASEGAIELRLDLTATHLVIEVTDGGSAAAPVLVHDGKEALVPHGWGLHIVDSLSESWGVRDAPGRRTVWSELRRPAAP